LSNKIAVMGCQCSSFDRHPEVNIDLKENFIDIVKSQAKEYQLLLYSRSTCNHSKLAKNLLWQNSIPFEYFELDNMNDDGQVTHALQGLTGSRRTPYIFLNGEFYGSSRELQKGIESGEVIQKLKECGN